MAAHDDKDQAAIQRKQMRLAKTLDLKINDAIKRTLENREGRAFIWWLLQQGKVGAQPFTTNALTTAFQCGELNVGNSILARITEVDPASYVRMQQEQLNEYREFADAAGSSPSGDTARPGAYDTSGGPDTIDDSDD